MTRAQRQHENRRLVEQLSRDGHSIARQFGLRVRCIEAERANVKRRYGICYADGTIRIRLRHATSGERLRYSSLVSTLCHELAHLRHFNHGERFKRFNTEVLAWARQCGIYRPSRESRRPVPARVPAVQALPARELVASQPHQLSLF